MFLERFWEIHARGVQNLLNNPLLRCLFGLVYFALKQGMGFVICIITQTQSTTQLLLSSAYKHWIFYLNFLNPVSFIPAMEKSGVNREKYWPKS